MAASFDELDQSTGVTFYVKNLTTGSEWFEATTGHTIGSLHNSTAAFNIGAYWGDGSRSWDGLIDEVRWSNTVLSSDQLLAVVPEPASVTMLFSALLAGGALLFLRRRK